MYFPWIYEHCDHSDRNGGLYTGSTDTDYPLIGIFQLPPQLHPQFQKPMLNPWNSIILQGKIEPATWGQDN